VGTKDKPDERNIGTIRVNLTLETAIRSEPDPFRRHYHC